MNCEHMASCLKQFHTVTGITDIRAVVLVSCLGAHGSQTTAQLRQHTRYNMGEVERLLAQLQSVPRAEKRWPIVEGQEVQGRGTVYELTPMGLSLVAAIERDETEAA